MNWQELCADPALQNLPYKMANYYESSKCKACSCAGEMNHKKELYFEKGAEEFWLCDLQGTMSFYNKKGELSNSELAPLFPATLDF